jgi:predicted aminopeptidase
MIMFKKRITASLKPNIAEINLSGSMEMGCIDQLVQHTLQDAAARKQYDKEKEYGKSQEEIAERLAKALTITSGQLASNNHFTSDENVWQSVKKKENR